MPRRNGYVLLDAVNGLVLVGILLVALVVMVVRQNRLAERLAESRSATTAVEDALSSLQQGRAPRPVSTIVLHAQPLPTDPVGDRIWVDVSAEQSGRTVNLVGLVPKRSFDQWQQQTRSEEGKQ